MNDIVLHDGIDAHQHFWSYDPGRHSWITDEMAAIRKDFMPADLKPVLALNGISGCVAVQADQTTAETDFLLELSRSNEFIKGVVGWVDLQSDDLLTQLSAYREHKKLKGFRHVLQGEEPGFMLQPSFIRGLSQLAQLNFTYDILVFPKHLPATLALIQSLPNQPFVIDHIAKPYIKDGLINEWKKDIEAIARYEHVHCKISGMVTEADMRNWKKADFRPYLDIVVEAFGMHRIMYGSDWPVCLAAGSYEQVIGIVKNYFSGYSDAEQIAFFKTNASSFYHLT